MSWFHTNSIILLLSSSFTTREPKFVFIFNFFFIFSFFFFWKPFALQCRLKIFNFNGGCHLTFFYSNLHQLRFARKCRNIGSHHFHTRTMHVINFKVLIFVEFLLHSLIPGCPLEFLVLPSSSFSQSSCKQR